MTYELTEAEREYIEWMNRQGPMSPQVKRIKR